MNIAAYCRVSTDEGISGTKIKNRKEFLRMMSDAEHGLLDMVVVKDISCFACNTVDLPQNIRKLKALGMAIANLFWPFLVYLLKRKVSTLPSV